MIHIITLLSGHGLAALATLARNLVLARLLGADDYGLAIAIAVIIAAAEMATTLGLPQLILSHKNGGSMRFQATLHAVQIARGVTGAIIVLIGAHPLATALGTPQSTPLFQAAAAVPFVLGFLHLDAFRLQRHQHHLPQALVLSVPAILSLLALSSPQVRALGPTAMLLLLVLQALATVATSHALAGRKYQIGFSATKGAIALRFGLPLAANGCLMFSVLHLEKLIAGVHLGLSDMGVLAMGLTLTLTPALISARSFQAYHLPRLRRTGEGIFGTSILLAMALALGLSTTIPMILPHLGDSFSTLGQYIPILSLIAATRLPKSALATAALAQSRTHLPAYANLPRLCAAPVIWGVLANGGGLNALLIIALMAELAGLAIGIYCARPLSKGVKGEVSA